MKPHFLKPITNRAEAEAYLRQLHADGDLYHLDDDAAEVVHGNGPGLADTTRSFTSEEALELNLRRDELFALDWSPHDDVFHFLLVEVLKEG
jgi:hypothetical protein